ncbi:hypothetical protein scyTo_0000414 [Scyliorhinus torazame]|uniref:Histamine H2 receptor n=1 Tax=Scyliorhinus torazame TaxID=75743 RepID=A0A401NWX7_SCYTO|nr:hypothetical protein [Scyliorhinus torazame]
MYYLLSVIVVLLLLKIETTLKSEAQQRLQQQSRLSALCPIQGRGKFRPRIHLFLPCSPVNRRGSAIQLCLSTWPHAQLGNTEFVSTSTGWMGVRTLCSPYTHEPARHLVAISLSLIWCISIMVSFLPINLGWNTKDLSVQSLGNTNQCHLELNKVYALVDALITFYIPLPIMCLTYYRIFKIAREQAKRINNVTGCTTLNPSLPTVKEHKATVTLATVMGVFVICWLPYFVVFTHEGISGHPPDKTVFAVVLWLGYVNSALNPILYAALNRDFRKAYQKLLRCGERNLYYRDSPDNPLTCQPLNSSVARIEQCQQLGQEDSADNELNSEDSNGEHVPPCKEASERDFVTTCGRSAEMICYCRDLWLTKVRLMKNLWSPENEETEVEPMGSQRMLDPGH